MAKSEHIYNASMMAEMKKASSSITFICEYKSNSS